MRYSPTQDLTSGEKDLLWKFRYYLTRDKRVSLFSFPPNVGVDENINTRI